MPRYRLSQIFCVARRTLAAGTRPDIDVRGRASHSLTGREPLVKSRFTLPISNPHEFSQHRTPGPRPVRVHSSALPLFRALARARAALGRNGRDHPFFVAFKESSRRGGFLRRVALKDRNSRHFVAGCKLGGLDEVLREGTRGIRA